MKPSYLVLTRVTVTLLFLSTIATATRSQEGAANKTATSPAQPAIERGLRYLREHGQAEDGTFSIEAGPGLTALAITAALRNGLPVDDPMVAKGLKALEGFVKPDSGIYGNGRLKNYETCVAIVAFQLANKDGRYKELLANADKFVRGLQIGGDGAAESSDPSYGGAGYGGGLGGRTFRTPLT